jgi:hypothetical protein
MQRRYLTALKKEYELVSRFWEKIENPTKEGLVEIIRKIDSRTPSDLDTNQREHGFGSKIYDQNNNFVAMGYSIGKWESLKLLKRIRSKLLYLKLLMMAAAAAVATDNNSHNNHLINGE